jgi:hypothetical protein
MFAKDERVTDEVPQDGDQASAAEALSEDGEDVLGANQATIEQSKARKRHEEHQCSADHHESVVAGTWKVCQGTSRSHVVEVLFDVSNITGDRF